MAALLAGVFDRQKLTDYRRFKGVINLNAAGAGQNDTFNPILVPSQYDLLLERVTIGGNGAASALVVLYENQVADTDMLEVIGMGTVGKYSDSFSNRIYVTANSNVLIAVTGGTPNLQVTYNLQGRYIAASGR
jgi:hypothetical protein